MIKFGSLFTGIGGEVLGLEAAGMFCAWMVEKEPFKQALLRKRFPDKTLLDDVRSASKQNLSPVDLVVGGFPCQDLSVSFFGSHLGLTGPSSGLVYEMARLCGELMPEWVVMENVIQVKKFVPALKEIFSLWELDHADLTAAHFGAYTRRKRTIIVGHLRERGGRKIFDHAEIPGSSFRTGGYEDVLPMCLPWKGGVSLERLGSCLVESAEADPTRIRKGDGLSRRMDGHRYLALGEAVPPAMMRFVGELILNR